MKIKQRRVLRPHFALKGNFAPGALVPSRKFDGIEIAPFKNGCSAAASISADFELNWAFRSLAIAERDHLGVTERENVPFILELLNKFGVPITWATVGHLFLSSCTSNGDCGHKDMPRPPLNPLWQGDWYMHDPCTDLQRDPLWYAPDLVEKILSAEVPHEIGSHSFSHINFSAQTSHPELVRREMEECLAAMQPFGLRLRSLVYPFNRMGHAYHDLLKTFGIIAVRHRDERVRLSYPERGQAGVYKIYESMNLREPSYYSYRDKAEIFLEKAIEAGAAYHLWFHPSDERSVFQKEFAQILELIQQQRESGVLWVATMGDLAAYCEARQSTTLIVQNENGKLRVQVRSSLDTASYGEPEITLILPGKGLPRGIARTRGTTLEQLSVPKCCVVRNGSLLLNVPAATQVINISF